MPPKNATADGSAANAGDAQSNTHGMSGDEVSFLVDCLMNPTGGGIVSIDCKAVAAARGQKNPGSISNRINKLKKKYNLPIGTGSGSSPRKAPDASEATVPNTPSNNKVTKGTRGRAVPKKANNKRAMLSEIDGEDVENDEDVVKSSSEEITPKVEEAESDDEDEFIAV